MAQLKALFYYKDDPNPVADISVKVADANAVAEAATKAFAEFARKHTGFHLVDGDVYVKFESTRSQHA